MDEKKSIEDSFIEKEQIVRVRENLQELAPSYKMIASLYYGESMPIKEIARIVKTSSGYGKKPPLQNQGDAPKRIGGLRRWKKNTRKSCLT